MNFYSFQSDYAPVLLLCWMKASIRHLAALSCSCLHSWEKCASPAQLDFGCPSKITYGEAVSVDVSQDESYMTSWLFTNGIFQ